jgi:uncharacterized membrane protein YdbT with pleckstrin-like domain
MADLIVRPSTKLIRPLYYLAILLAIGLYFWNSSLQQPLLPYIYILPLLLVVAAAIKHIGLLFTVMTVAAGKLRYETGMLAKSTRTIEIHKVQDVRVDESLSQRIVGIGNISIETAGETSRLTMANIDKPHAIADKILEAART